MADDSMYYGGDEEGGDSEKPSKEKESSEATALLPKSILGGKEFKVGEEVVLKITHDYGDEVEVAYATEKPKESETEGGDEEMTMDKAKGQLDSMATGY